MVIGDNQRIVIAQTEIDQWEEGEDEENVRSRDRQQGNVIDRVLQITELNLSLSTLEDESKWATNQNWERIVRKFFNDNNLVYVLQTPNRTMQSIPLLHNKEQNYNWFGALAHIQTVNKPKTSSYFYICRFHASLDVCVGWFRDENRTLSYCSIYLDLLSLLVLTKPTHPALGLFLLKPVFTLLLYRR